ncbi:heavy metal translocating P-type ATPase [Helicobacter turcicus]|uniref:Cation-translocating P-type ATPase n=1 Tax=Helicobacter turcicus TaxID=2867412 RepID=A0ABS7JMC4_9HELI|nr:cation-translocating P-type ATPase [Helicobacter turcicus]MBX7490536.1 cation-translocating P-type ATPase [Helicobacter turcicus]MBX7545395.1 cation-translocating P-type ATPase [Helicobacter turcicus]
MDKVKLNISGMHCSACSASIEKNLQKIPAITNIKINAISGRAKIAFDGTKISAEEIIDLITSYGFPASFDDSKAEEIAYIKNLKQRLLVAIPLFLGIFVLHMGGFHSVWSGVLQLLLASVVQFYCGYPFYKGAKSFLKTKSADMNVLIALGTSVAYVYSVYLFALGESGFYFEGSSAVICFVLVGEYLKSSAKKKASDGVAMLASILPTQARLVELESKTDSATKLNLQSATQENIRWIAIDAIKKGDVCLVLSGEKIPLDGVVLSGKAEVSSAHINGEELPKVIECGAEVVGGSLVLNGELEIRANKDANAFFVYEMLDLLELSQSQKPPIGRLADKIASVFVPSVVLISVLAFAIWLVLGKDLAFALSIAASVLVISCPCALGLATPLAIVCASVRAKSLEILIKTPNIYEKAQEIKTIVFDKTGTLTKGEIAVKECKVLTQKGEEFVKSVAKTLQQNNPHPIAKAILEFAKDSVTLPLNAREYEIAKGVKGEINGEKYYFGQLEWVESCTKVSIKKGENAIALASESEILALFYLQDSIKESARATINALKKRGIVPIILSGDNTQSVEKVAKELGITEFFASISPLQKAEIVAELAKKGNVCFVGDGINDALALKEASFGISFIEATQLAQEVGDVLLLKNNLWGIVEVFDLSSATLHNIKENLFFAYVYNIVLIPIAAGVLYPWLGIVMQPAFAGAAMALSSLSVVGNALRISKIRLEKCEK